MLKASKRSFRTGSNPTPLVKQSSLRYVSETKPGRAQAKLKKLETIAYLRLFESLSYDCVVIYGVIYPRGDRFVVCCRCQLGCA